MKRIASWVTLASTVLVIAACDQSHTSSSSGSNWLRCRVFTDCDAAERRRGLRQRGLLHGRARRTLRCHGRSSLSRSPSLAERRRRGSRGPGAGRDLAAPAADGGAATLCPWGVDELLGAVGAAAEERIGCGQYSGRRMRERRPLRSRLLRPRAAGAAAPSNSASASASTAASSTTYVATSAGKLFAVYMQDRYLGVPDGPDGSTRVQACSAIELQEGLNDPVCANAVELQNCRGLRTDEPPPAPSGHLQRRSSCLRAPTTADPRRSRSTST